MKTPRLLLALLAFVPLMVAAQTGSASYVQEDELRTCLMVEQESQARFKTLEDRASQLRATEQQLAERKSALSREKSAMSTKRPDALQVTKLNESINAFNTQTDEFNASKDKFDQDYQTHEQWMNTSMRPVCSKLAGKPVPPVTSFFACGYNTSSSPLTGLDHCKTLPNLEKLKSCIQQAGSKAKARETCNAP